MAAFEYVAAKTIVVTAATPESSAYRGWRTAATRNPEGTRRRNAPNWANARWRTSSTLPATSASGLTEPWNWRAKTTSQKPLHVSGWP